MEKKRSPRSCKSSGTSNFPKSPLLYENYKSGCGWKLINFFDLRHVKSANKKPSSDKKSIRDSAGNVYTKSQLGLLKQLHEKFQCNDRTVEEENLIRKKVNNLKDGTCEMNLQVCVNEAAETLICSRGKDRSKQFMEALEILSSNKELFITLLQDPKSFSAKKGQDLEEDLDKVALLKPRLSSSVDEGVYLRFKHIAKNLNLVGGSNNEEKPECSGYKARETEYAAFRTRFGRGSRESPVHRRKKRVESDVFKLGTESNVSPRRFSMERQQERLDSSPVYEVPNELDSLQTKLKERRQKLEKRRESLKLWTLDNNFEVFDPKPQNSDLRYFDDNCTGSTDYRSLRTREEGESLEVRYRESFKSMQESISRLEREDIKVHDPKHEQEQPSPVSVLERIPLEDKTVSLGYVEDSKLEEQIGISFDDQHIDLVEKDSVLDFVKKVLEASRLNLTNLMTKCSQETSLLDEFSHGNHNKHQLLLVLDYTDEILRGIYSRYIKFRPFTPPKSSRREEDLIQETMRCFDWCYDSRRTVDQIIETDVIKSCLWLDSGGECEGVVDDVVDEILEHLVLEIADELRTMQRRVLC